jgi:DNA-binding NarL/FixJ family response regulator
MPQKQTRELTPEELSVMCMLLQGFVPKQIAYKTGFCIRTITHHISTAREALGADTRDQAAAYFAIRILTHTKTD